MSDPIDPSTDDDDFSPAESYPALERIGRLIGWGDPEMDIYDNYDENLRLRIEKERGAQAGE